MEITAEVVRNLFHYDAKTGVFTRKLKARGATVGRVVGANCNGYLAARVGKKNYLLHRIAWLYVYGDAPSLGIDHIDGNKKNNAIANLRLATPSQNAQNLKVAQDRTKSALLGVHWDKTINKWRSNIVIEGKRKYLGVFTDPNEAHNAYLTAKRQLHSFSTI